MEALFIERSLLFNIVMNMDIEDLYKLYQTNHTIQNFINEKYTMTALSEKYNARYLYYDEGYYTFFDLVWDAIIDNIGFSDPNMYLKEEIIRAVAVINNRFLNSGDKITNCDYHYDYTGEHVEWICKAAAFLNMHGFDIIIRQIYDEIDNVIDYKERNKIYIDWLKLLKLKALSYLNVNTLLDKPFTEYKNGRIFH